MGTGIGPQNLGEPGGKEGHTACGHKKPETQVIGVEISPLTKPSDEELAKIRKEPGMSNAGKYNVAAYAGPNESYPINTIDRGRAALKLAWKAGPKLEKQIKENVYKKYSSLRPDNNSQNA